MKEKEYSLMSVYCSIPATDTRVHEVLNRHTVEEMAVNGVVTVRDHV